MFTDIVIPGDNEEEFAEMGKKLNYDELYFIYPVSDFVKRRAISGVKFGILAKPNEIAKAKKLSDFVIVRSSRDNRHVIEKLKPGLIFDLEREFRKDFIHQRASGLNHIICRLAKENKVAIGFSFSTVLEGNPKIIGRMKQNIRLCRKYGVKTAIASFATNPYSMRAPRDLAAFFTSIGMHPAESRNSLIKEKFI